MPNRPTKINHKPPNSAHDLKREAIPKTKSKKAANIDIFCAAHNKQAVELFLVQNDFSLALIRLMRNYCDHRPQKDIEWSLNVEFGGKETTDESSKK
jgi:hypothetical protein